MLHLFASVIRITKWFDKILTSAGHHSKSCFSSVTRRGRLLRLSVGLDYSAAKTCSFHHRASPNAGKGFAILKSGTMLLI